MQLYVEDSVLESTVLGLWLTKQKKAKERKATAIATVIFAGANFNFSTLNALIGRDSEKNKF